MAQPTAAIAGCPDASSFVVTSHALNAADFCADDCLAYQAIGAACVTKPFNPGRLMSTIRHWLALAGT